MDVLSFVFLLLPEFLVQFVRKRVKITESEIPRDAFWGTAGELSGGCFMPDVNESVTSKGFSFIISPSSNSIRECMSYSFKK